MKDQAPHLRALESPEEAQARLVREFIATGQLRFSVNGKRLEPGDLEVVRDERADRYVLLHDGIEVASMEPADMERIARGPSGKRRKKGGGR